jgi:hypothetical protein
VNRCPGVQRRFAERTGFADPSGRGTRKRALTFQSVPNRIPQSDNLQSAI